MVSEYAGWGISYYRGALDSAQADCERLEKALRVDRFVMRTFVEQMDMLVSAIEGGMDYAALRQHAEAMAEALGTVLAFEFDNTASLSGSDWDEIRDRLTAYRAESAGKEQGA